MFRHCGRAGSSKGVFVRQSRLLSAVESSLPLASNLMGKLKPTPVRSREKTGSSQIFLRCASCRLGSLPFFPCDPFAPDGRPGLVRLFYACHQAAMGAAGTSTKETSIWLRTRTPLPLQLRPHRRRHRLTSRTKSEIAKAARASGLASAVHGRTATARASTSSLNACRSTVASRSVSLLTRRSDCSTTIGGDGRVIVPARCLRQPKEIHQ